MNNILSQIDYDYYRRLHNKQNDKKVTIQKLDFRLRTL
jgi:hypothetical protein